MPIDPDQIRVDLLLIKRKIYTSYPEGSKERQDFLIASKRAELKYLQALVTPEMIELIYEEYVHKFKLETLNFFACGTLGLSFSIMFLALHRLHPATLFLNLWFFPVVVGLLFAGWHVYHIYQNWQRFQPFRADYLILKSKI